MTPIKSEHHGPFDASNGQSLSSLGTVVPFLRSASVAVDTILTTKARVMPQEQAPPPPSSPYSLITRNKNNSTNNETSVMRSRTMPVRGPTSNTPSATSSLRNGYAITRHTRTNDSESIKKGNDILKSILETRDDVEDMNVVLPEDSSASFSGSSLCKRDENLSSSGRQSDSSGSASRTSSLLLPTSSTTSSISSFRRRFLEVNQSMDNLSCISSTSGKKKNKKNNDKSSRLLVVQRAR